MIFTFTPKITVLGGVGMVHKVFSVFSSLILKKGGKKNAFYRLAL